MLERTIRCSMSPELAAKKSKVMTDIRILSDRCTYINKLKDAVSNIKDVKLKNFYSETLNSEIFKVKPELYQLKIEILEILNEEEKQSLPLDFNLYKISKSLDWLKG